MKTWITLFAISAYLVTAGSVRATEPVPLTKADLRINEIMPNPVGTDTGQEWVELANTGQTTLDISTAKVVRGNGSTVITFNAGISLEPGAYLKVASGSLINTGDTLTLFTGTVEIDKVTYDGSGQEGWSWSRIDALLGQWVQTPTPAAANALPTPSPAPSDAPGSQVLPGQVWLNELSPNPTGVDTGHEWIELRNVTPEELDLGGLVIRRDSGETLATVPSGIKVSPDGYYMVEDVSGSMINAGDTLQLWSGEVLIDQVTYDGEGQEGYTWARIDAGTGYWSPTPTPNAPNSVSVGGNPETLIPALAATTAGSSVAPKATASKAASKKKAAAKKTTKASAKKLPASGMSLLVYALPALLIIGYGVRRWKRLS